MVASKRPAAVQVLRDIDKDIDAEASSSSAVLGSKLRFGRGGGRGRGRARGGVGRELRGGGGVGSLCRCGMIRGRYVGDPPAAPAGGAWAS